MTGKFWVFDWLADNHITSLEQAAILLPKYKVIDDLQTRAISAEENDENNVDFARNETQIVAGTGIDLSGGNMVCPSPECMRAQVDKLFRRVWHYFDRIVVRYVFTPALTEESIQSRKKLIDELLSHLPPLLYLQEIGATHLLYFRSKELCRKHRKQHANEEGLSELIKKHNKLRNEFSKTARFYFSDEGQWKGYYWLDSRDLPSHCGIDPRKYPAKSEKQLQQKLLDNALMNVLSS